MKLQLKRIHDDGDTTVGVLSIDGVAQCFIVEDQHNTKKVYGETRIPNGTYSVNLRKEGRFFQQYRTKFGQKDGVLCIHNAPNWKIEKDGVTFQYVLIHIGNSDEDTAGCLLPNTAFSFDTMVGSGSALAYLKIYKKIHKALMAGEIVSIEITS